VVRRSGKRKHRTPPREIDPKTMESAPLMRPSPIFIRSPVSLKFSLIELDAKEASGGMKRALIEILKRADGLFAPTIVS
jgi:hypothetical protein